MHAYCDLLLRKHNYRCSPRRGGTQWILRKIGRGISLFAEARQWHTIHGTFIFPATHEIFREGPETDGKRRPELDGDRRATRS